MTLTFFSNYMNHHQRPLCDALYQNLGSNFYFVATEEMSEKRKQLGYDNLENDRPYVIKTYDPQDAKKNIKFAQRLVEESDVIIFGSAPEEYLEQRLRQDKLTFRYHERYFKEGRWRILDPRVFISHYKKDFRYRKKNLFMLCASAYTAPDCRFIHCYRNKAFKWGYFPPVKQYDSIEEMIERKHPVSILWVARFIKLKHPEAPLYVAKQLKKAGYSFEMNLIGRGELEDQIKETIRKEDLQDQVKLLGAMSPEAVREHMERSEIFLFTSDRNEGWGAVLNESMNSGCAVVANRAIGSVPFLLKDGENGMIYNGRIDDLYKKVKFLLDNDEKRKRMSVVAYQTLAKTWNAEVAVERLFALIEKLKKGEKTSFADGPCSMA